MRAYVLTGPREGSVREVAPPRAAAGEVVVEVDRVGLCGTDVEFFTGEMAYLHQGLARYPIRLGHEWCGRVVTVGDGADRSWTGRRVTGDTMIGDGSCRRCRRGRAHVCAQRQEVGIRDRDGALAELVAVPARSLHALPDAVDDSLGALVEPAANAWRATQAAQLAPADRIAVLGPGTIGLLAAMFARAAGAEVHLTGLTEQSRRFARSLGFEHVWPADDVPDLPFDAVVDATTAADAPARALDLVEPAGRVVCIGLAGTASTVDTRTITLKDVTVVGILSGSPGLDAAIAAFANGTIDPRPLVAATVGLDQVGAVLAGERPAAAGAGPKIHIDPTIYKET